MAKKKAENNPTFEEALKELEDIVCEMEEGTLDLDRALLRFERGIALSRICAGMLDQAEKKIDILICGENGEISLKPAKFTEEPDA